MTHRRCHLIFLFICGRVPPQRLLPWGKTLLSSVLSENSSRRSSANSKRIAKMNHLDFQQNAVAACEEMRGLLMICDQKGPVFCPKPRRVGVIADRPERPFRLQMSHQAELCDSQAGAELLDIILKKSDFGTEQSANHVASSPPFFCGSPPSRAANPLVRDARFGDELLSPISTLQTPSPSGVPSPRKGGCVRMKLGFKPAAVRVEGFNCLNRDRQNSSIPAMA